MRVTNDTKDKIYKFRSTNYLATKIDNYCKKRNLNVSDFLRMAVEEYIRNHDKNAL